MNDLLLYPRTVFWSDEDGGFIAVAPDLPGSSAFGNTREQALAELEDAMRGWVEAARAAGNPVPPPSPPMPDAYSGRVLLRMPKSLHRDLAETAKREGVSLNLQIVADLEAARVLRAADRARTSDAPVRRGAGLARR